MMTSKTLYARVGVAAIAASVAFSPTLAAGPKPVVDLSQSPALSGKPDAAAPAARPAKPNPFNGPFDERTLEFGGGALAVIVLGGAAIALNRRRRRREDEEAWQYEQPVAEQPASYTVASPPVPDDQPVIVAPEASAFSWGDGRTHNQASSSAKADETWVERAMRGPTPDNPSQSLRKRLKRAAFFDKRDREVAAGEARAVEGDAGLPEKMEEPQRHLEAA
jgi:hypothetical protein